MASIGYELGRILVNVFHSTLNMWIFYFNDCAGNWSKVNWRAIRVDVAKGRYPEGGRYPDGEGWHWSHHRILWTWRELNLLYRHGHHL